MNYFERKAGWLMTYLLLLRAAPKLHTHKQPHQFRLLAWALNCFFVPLAVITWFLIWVMVTIAHLILWAVSRRSAS
jgi:hypothetical protein